MRSLIAYARAPWAQHSDIQAALTRMELTLRVIHRKVTNMAVDTQAVARLVAASGALAEQARKAAAERDAYKAALDAATAAEAIEDLDEAAATEQIVAAADAVEALLAGPDTPDVTPVPIEDVPDVVGGDQPVTDPSGLEITPDEPLTGENPGTEQG